MKTQSFLDYAQKFRRGPQVITRKDAASIVAETGLKNDWACLDLGGGSGFLCLFVANLLYKGKITVYEIKKENAAIIKENVRKSGLRNVVVKNMPAEKFTGRNFDLITMDMKGAEKLVGKCHGSLKDGGFLAVYSPHIEQQIRCRKAMEKAGFRKLKTVENTQKEWKIDTRGYSHPLHSQLVHTGFITIARKA